MAANPMAGRAKIILSARIEQMETLEKQERFLRETLKLSPDLVPAKTYDRINKQLSYILDQKVEILQSYAQFIGED